MVVRLASCTVPVWIVVNSRMVLRLADLEPGRLVLVLHVLRTAANRRVMADAVVFANRRVAFDHAMRADGRARADHDVRPDDRVRTDFDGFVELSARLDDRGRVNLAHAPSPCVLFVSPEALRQRLAYGRVYASVPVFFTVHISSASAATAPSTSARRLEFPDAAHVALERDVQDQLVARFDDALEARSVDADEVIQRRLRVVRLFPRTSGARPPARALRESARRASRDGSGSDP